METIEITHLEEKYNIDVIHTNENLSGYFIINWDNPNLSKVLPPPIKINYDENNFNIPKGNLNESALLLSIILGIITNSLI